MLWHSLGVAAVVSSAAINVDSLGARAALDIATPVVLAVAAMSHLYCFYRVSTTTAHRSAASGPRMILLTLAAITYKLIQRSNADNKFAHLGVHIYNQPSSVA